MTEAVRQATSKAGNLYHFFEGEKMMAQSTMTKGASSNSKNGGSTPANLPLISSLASLDRFFAGSGEPVNNPGMPSEGERGRAASKKSQLEFVAPFEVGPYR
jgi:hypothetical protein